MNIWRILWAIFFHDFNTARTPADRSQARLAMRGSARTYAGQKRTLT